MTTLRFELYRDGKGEYRWRLKRGDEVVAKTGEGFTSSAGARAGIERVKAEAPSARVEDLTGESDVEPVDVLVDHLANCVKPDAVLVVDGNGDDLVTTLLAEGWTLGTTEYVAGKRIRNMVPPATAEVQG